MFTMLPFDGSHTGVRQRAHVEVAYRGARRRTSPRPSSSPRSGRGCSACRPCPPSCSSRCRGRPRWGSWLKYQYVRHAVSCGGTQAGPGSCSSALPGDVGLPSPFMSVTPSDVTTPSSEEMVFFQMEAVCRDHAARAEEHDFAQLCVPVSCQPRDPSRRHRRSRRRAPCVHFTHDAARHATRGRIDLLPREGRRRGVNCSARLRPSRAPDRGLAAR